VLIEEEADIVSDTESKLSEFLRSFGFKLWDSRIILYLFSLNYHLKRLFICLSIILYFPALQGVIERRGVNKPLIAAMGMTTATVQQVIAIIHKVFWIFHY